MLLDRRNISESSTADHRNSIASEHGNLECGINQLSHMSIREENRSEESCTEHGEPIHGQSSHTIFNCKYTVYIHHTSQTLLSIATRYVCMVACVVMR